MEKSTFGATIRELRKASGLSQREVAERVKISFTYLSKIESGAMGPPKEDVIRKLAQVLDGDEHKLITLAGKVPSDWKQAIVQGDEKVLQFLRSYTADKANQESKGERQK